MDELLSSVSFLSLWPELQLWMWASTDSLKWSLYKVIASWQHQPTCMLCGNGERARRFVKIFFFLMLLLIVVFVLFLMKTTTIPKVIFSPICPSFSLEMRLWHRYSQAEEFDSAACYTRAHFEPYFAFLVEKKSCSHPPIQEILACNQEKSTTGYILIFFVPCPLQLAFLSIPLCPGFST